MRGGGNGDPDNLQATAWLHRQNIQRYEALLRDPADHESHDQIRELLDEEEEKLRSLDPKQKMRHTNPVFRAEIFPCLSLQPLSKLGLADRPMLAVIVGWKATDVLP
jgi:hypothetical protein